jgi:hypothetical protein
MLIDTSFNFHSDAGGGDPNSISPTLRKYHKILWSKPFPSGKTFKLCDDKSGVYLYHKSELGEFFLGSDSGARGCNYLIDDRFDLTLECIRLFYLGQKSPLYDTLLRYKTFFDLFDNFNDYILFFFLEDLVDENGKIKFYLPFDDFKTRPTFFSTNEYLIYKSNVMNFIRSRNKRIEEYIN